MMACFCSATMSQLSLALPSLNVSLTASASLALAADMRLAASFCPTLPWQPDEAWLSLQLPTIGLSASAMATISAFAQLRASVMAVLGIDLAIPGQATAFIRLVATLEARLSAMASLSIDASAWVELSATMTACAQVTAALQAGLYAGVAVSAPAPVWRPFLLRIRALLPILAVSAQMNVRLTAAFAAELSAAISVMMRIALPAFPSMSLMLSLTTALSAVAQLRLSLGIDPIRLGLPAVQAMVAARVQATMQLAASLGINLSLPLPQLSFDLGIAITPAVVNMAMALDAQAMASLNWQVPAVVPVLQIGLPAVGFVAQLNAALRLAPSLSPCSVCNAAGLLQASLHA